MHGSGWAGGLQLQGCPLLSPCLCLGCAAAPTQSLPLQCVLTGHWINDLGSTMHIHKLQENGSFNGTYLTVPSMSPKKIPPSPLLGFQQHTDQPTFGFTVKWKSTSTSLFQASLTVPRTALASLWCPQCSPALHVVSPEFPCPSCDVPTDPLCSTVVFQELSHPPCDVPDPLLPFPAVPLMIP